MNTNSKITLLGTVSDIKVLNNNRTAAGIILDVDNNQILIDPGVGTIVRSDNAKIELKNINVILSSSSDTIYTNDINAVIEHTNKDIHLICSKELIKHDESILTSKHAKNLKIVTVEEEKQTSIRGIDIQAINNKVGISYKINTSKFVLGYITKAKYSKSFVEWFKDANILIINTTLSKPEKNSSYLDIEEITELIREVSPELVILNGFSEKTIKADPLDISRKIKQELQKNKQVITKTQILPAKELMTINPEAYNIRLKQKNLNGFFN